MNVQPFGPGATVTLAATTTSGRVQLSGVGSAVEVQNDGTTTMFIVKGGATVTATNAGYPIFAGQSKVISRDPANETHIAAIMASGTANLYATVGEGL